MSVNLEEFDSKFNSGINEMGSGQRADQQTILDLCIDKDTDRQSATMGKVVTFPILSRDFKFIHFINKTAELWAVIKNPKYDPNDPNSRKFSWKIFRYVHQDSYKTKLTPDEASLNEQFLNKMKEYHELKGSKFGLRVGAENYFKGLLLFILRGGASRYTDMKDKPIIFKHKSTGFREAYRKFVLDSKSLQGESFIKNLFIPETMSKLLVITTNRPNVAYETFFEVLDAGNKTENIEYNMDILRSWMDFDIHELGVDTTTFNVNMARDFVENFNQYVELYKEYKGGVTGGTIAPASNVSNADIDALLN